MKNKSYKVLLEEYQNEYGDIPLDHEEILDYLKDNLKLTEKDMEKINSDNEKVRSIPWETLKIILPIIPKPSPRPRYSSASRCFYVTGAAENKKLLKYYLTEKYNIIYTQTYFDLITYLPTPIKSMNRWEVYRAEQKEIAVTSNPDWDNLGKTYSDMIQKILILNDNILTKGNVEKYYSVKPRVEITIKYQLGFDSKFNKRKICNTKSYRDYIEAGNPIEIYTDEYDYF